MSLGVLCAGQGDQSSAMFDLVPTDGAPAEVLEIAREVLGDDPRRIGPERRHRNAVAQPLVAAVQLATWAALRDRLPPARVFAGYSLGELTAHGCAGAVDFATAVRLARDRATAMDAACAEPGGLRAVRGLRRAELAGVCGPRHVEVAIVNGPDRIVIGGAEADLAACEPALVALGAKVTPLRVCIASHTSRMRPAVGVFRAALLAAGLGDPRTPVLAGIDGAPVLTRERAIDVLSRQLAETVAWSSCLEGLVEMGCSALLELGPGSGLARMARDRFPDMEVRAVEEFRSLEGVAAWASRAVSR
ncbi:MAG: ACP S-malonyltransferase [Anaeromyxobacteraceae bacterium]